MINSIVIGSRGLGEVQKVHKPPGRRECRSIGYAIEPREERAIDSPGRVHGAGKDEVDEDLNTPVDATDELNRRFKINVQ